MEVGAAEAVELATGTGVLSGSEPQSSPSSPVEVGAEGAVELGTGTGVLSGSEPLSSKSSAAVSVGTAAVTVGTIEVGRAALTLAVPFAKHTVGRGIEVSLESLG